jgi:hypothetical protein
MAVIIEFYVPKHFRYTRKWIASELRGRVIPFFPRLKRIA